ncbi:MAG: hypothetical protein WCF68_05675, partial [Terriglobales bacterium]
EGPAFSCTGKKQVLRFAQDDNTGVYVATSRGDAVTPLLLRTPTSAKMLISIRVQIHPNRESLQRRKNLRLRR